MELILPVERSRVDEKFMPIYLDCLRVDSVLNFDLYIKVEGNLVLYRSADLPFTEASRQKLIESRVERLYVATVRKADYQRYIEQNLDKILEDPEVPEEKKAGILYETSANIVKDVLANPTYGDNIRRSKDLVGNTVSYILQGREAFHNLLRITSFDYYTYTHSVNVCTFSIALAQQLGHSDERLLHDLGVGALLHDVGKSKISDRILNKRAPLTPYEQGIMKNHPKWGADILTETDEVSSASYYPVLQHHERGDRSGYPHSLSLDEMHLFSKIVAIADTFDAMTTDRVYQKASGTFDTLKVMLTLTTHFDEKLLKAFVELMGPNGLKPPTDKSII